MIIPDYKIGTSFEITCTKTWKQNQWLYRDFEISKEHSSIFGRKPEDVIKVRMTIIENDTYIKGLYQDNNYDENCTDYFGRINFEKKRLRIGCIYGNIKAYTVCFPDEPDVGLFWENDIKIPGTNKIEYHKGERRAMNVRLKIEEI